MAIYNIAIIGAGAAGCMAAIRAGELTKNVILIERNDAPGRKILITGKGRCNITNTAPLDDFIEKFGPGGQFLRTAFSRFSNEDLMAFFTGHGLELKTERQGRVFPASDNALSVVNTLIACLATYGVETRCRTRVTAVTPTSAGFTIITETGEITARTVILTTGGASYKKTGSTGDGFTIAGALGHTVSELLPGLVPLKTKETWVKEVQGLTLKNIRLTFTHGKRRISSPIGELLFTHFGVSGPLILDLSGELAPLIAAHGAIALTIDLKTGYTEDELDRKIIDETKTGGTRDLKNFLKPFLPVNLIAPFIAVCGIDPVKKANQITQKERRALVGTFKRLPLTISGTLPLEEAMVTCGGIALKEINPRTMSSRLVPGLYVAGEIVAGGAASGGYNLQQAFSTGHLAGESAAQKVAESAQ